MSTIIYPSPIFGPVHSRRLGVSLGINLMPADGKVCTFDCLYCECGFNNDFRPTLPRPTRQQVATALEATLQQMQHDGRLPDVLTFAGNGEPTAHPHFAEIISDTIRLRNQYCPNAKVSVLSNATLLHREAVFNALLQVDNNIQKLDTVSPEYIRLVDRPTGAYDVQAVIRRLKAFHGHVIIQTMFMKGQWAFVEVRGTRCEVREMRVNMNNVEGLRYSRTSYLAPRTSKKNSYPVPGQCSTLNAQIDNTGEEYVGPWLDAIRDIAPQQVMVYTIDRETPARGLQKATHEELDAIRDRVIALGIPCTASY